jgi:DNA polymerase (family 10)
MTNATIAEAFDLIGDILDFKGENPFRVRAYRNAARTIRDYPEPLARWWLGKKSSKHRWHWGRSRGQDHHARHHRLIAELEDLKNRFPIVCWLCCIPGFGPKSGALA